MFRFNQAVDLKNRQPEGYRMYPHFAEIEYCLLENPATAMNGLVQFVAHGSAATNCPNVRNYGFIPPPGTGHNSAAHGCANVGGRKAVREQPIHGLLTALTHPWAADAQEPTDVDLIQAPRRKCLVVDVLNRHPD